MIFLFLSLCLLFLFSLPLSITIQQDIRTTQHSDDSSLALTHDVTHLRDMLHFYMCHDSIICVTFFDIMLDMAHLCVRFASVSVTTNL